MLEDFRMATEIPQFMPLWIKKKNILYASR